MRVAENKYLHGKERWFLEPTVKRGPRQHLGLQNSFARGRFTLPLLLVAIASLATSLSCRHNSLFSMSMTAFLMAALLD